MKKILFYFCFLFCQTLFCQDAQFTQFDRSALYLNPAFAGTSQQYRVGIAHRNQWIGLDANFQTTYLGFDLNVPHIRSGFGIIGVFDQVGSALQLHSALSGIYSFYVPFRSWQMRLGVQAGVGNRYLNSESLVFTSQVLDNEPDVFEGGASASKTYFDVGGGVLFFNQNFWIGASFHHLNRPNYSLYKSTISDLPIKMSVQMGANWQIRTPTGSIFVLPAFLYKQQGAAQQFEASLRMAFEGFPIVGGISYRGIPFKQNFGYISQDAFNFMAIFQTERFSVGYSYDWTISQLAPYSGGSHEISLEFLWQTIRYNPRDIVCPTFMKTKKTRR